MAAIMTKRGSQDNVITYEFMCESAEDMASIDRKYITLGSICIVINDGAMDIYIADSAHEWHSLSIGASGGSSGDAGASLSIYICANNEVSNGLPNISEPDENTIYLVASGNTSGNLYEEYIYVDSAWEKFGAASIDLSNYATKSELPDMSLYAPKTNPVFTGSVSMGRSSSIGTGSTALGYYVEASGDYSHAEGTNTTASNTSAHAEGSMTTASGAGAHTEGGGTFAGGDYSHAEGGDTVVNHAYQHAFGTYNNPDSSLATIHQKGTYIEIVGNGTAYNARSNARALDWDGNEYLKGDLYVGCNADSTGGAKVATESFVTTRVPAPPVADGTYNLQVVVSSGTATYSWVAAPGSASGVSF